MGKYQVGSIYTNKRNQTDYKIVEEDITGRLRLIRLPEVEGAESKWVKPETLRKTYSLKAEPKVVARKTTSSYPTHTTGVTGFATKEEAKTFIKQARETYSKASHFQVELASKPLAQQGFLWQVREWRYIGQ